MVFSLWPVLNSYDEKALVIMLCTIGINIHLENLIYYQTCILKLSLSNNSNTFTETFNILFIFELLINTFFTEQGKI